MAHWADVEFRKMIKHRRAHDFLLLLVDILMLWDFLAGLACGKAAHVLWCARFPALDEGGASAGTFLPEIVIGSLILAFTLRSVSIMKRSFPSSTPRFIALGQRRSSYAIITLLAVVFAVQIGYSSSQTWIIAWFVLLATIIGATRWGVDCYLARLEKRGVLREAVAIVGASGARERLASRIAAKADIVGFCETPLDQAGFLQQDEIEKLQELGAEGCLDSVVFAFETDQAEGDISSLIERLKILPAQLAICDDAACLVPGGAAFRLLADVPIKIVADQPINRRDLLIKTILDKTGAAILLVLLLPLMAVIAVVIAATSRGPVIFRQTRQGWCGKRFTVFKFRTMLDMPHAGGRYTQTKRKDPRCTGFGRLLRSTSLDELPQLWNIVRGEMSLVGPRPHADMLDEMDQAGRKIIAEYAQRFRVKPGITGWAQIHGARGATSTVEQLRRRVTYDLYYIEHWSLWLDLEIVARTPLCMMGKNVF